MFQLSKENIKNIAADQTVYLRGVRYYKNNLVSNVKWSKANHQYFATVSGSNDYQVMIEMDDNHLVQHSCNCPAHAKYPGACKHVVAMLLFISDYSSRAGTKKPSSKEEQTIYNIIEYFENQDDVRAYGDIFLLEVTIHIPGLLRGNQGKAFISLKAGSNRFYKIQNLRKFLADYYNKENIILGKEFKFLQGESSFTKESQAILDYLLEIYEIQEALGKVYYSNLFTKSQLTLTKNMLLKILGIMKEQTFELELFGEVYHQVVFKKENPKISLGISLQDDILTIDYKNKHEMIPLIDDGKLLFGNDIVYAPQKAFLMNYVPFYNSLGKQNSTLNFQGEQKDKFLKVVLPKINETMEIDIPELLKDKYVSCDVKTSIYLDRIKTNIKASISFKYGEYEINPLDYVAKDGVIIVRQPDKENEIISCLEKLHFMPSKNYFLLKDEHNIFEFFAHGLLELQKLCEIYYSSDFKGLSIKNTGKLHTTLRVNNDLNLLEMELDYEEVPKEELKALFHSLQLKKKYHRLKNGSFINLQEESMEAVSSLFEQLNITGKNLSQDVIALPKNNAFYLNQILENSVLDNVEKNESFTSLVDNILGPDILDYQVPEEINATLRPYQVLGYKWLRTLSNHGLGGILADDMGLGKTLQAIVYIASLLLQEHDKKQTFLIVCPTSLVYNWQEEFGNFAPFIKTVVIGGAPEQRKDLLLDYAKVDVIITSYPLIRRDIEYYENIVIHTMFIDEAQFIKNANSISAKSVKNINAAHKFALTGTPIENSLSELWSIFDFIMPYYLLTHSKFIERYEKPIVKEENQKVLEDLGKHIQPFILRRMKKDVLTELPEKIETKFLTELTEGQKKIYLSYLENIRKDISGEINENASGRSNIKILAALTRLRQICCHPSTFIENYTESSGKLELLKEILPEILANEHRILIFSQFTSMLAIIAKELVKQKISYFYLEGSTSMQDRSDYVKRFNAGEGSVFLISLKAGGTGLNLTGADTVIHYDPWWNPAVEEQATDRVYRIGQKNSVHVIKLITKGTIEEKIYKLQKRKKALSDSIIQSKEVFINQLSKEELEDLFH